MEYKYYPSLEKATIGQYVDLFRDAFHRDTKFTVDYLTWQYLKNPHGRAIGIDAFEEDQLVAHYCIIPRNYIHNERLYRSALSVNTATHPEHQGKGLFTKLAEMTYENASQAGIQFIVGVANQYSVNGFIKKLGFSNFGQIHMNISYKAFLNKEDGLKISHDDKWLKWRFNNPSREYKFINHSDETVTIRTKVRGGNFNIFRIDSSLFTGEKILEISTFKPALTPNFGLKNDKLFRIPKRFHPSPWHLIWRSLDNRLPEGIQKQIQFDGLSMDTF
jgi:GNAT superfamily N-acetyltransferase